ncbi:adenylosuccinate synthase [Candidatus Peregrinibacteria bacterium]|nr:adenylosuccinate synthase [Candidatus Peregrinibacteria bacterium]
MSNFINTLGNLAAVVGAQWGDEGKGKLIDILSDKYDIIVRAAGGANAGHTIYLKDPNSPEGRKKFVFHLVPSGMFNPNCACVIGNGVALHLQTFLEEVDLLNNSGIDTKDRIFISDRAHLLFEYHKIIDGKEEEMKGDKKVGTTKRGIGPCYTDKTKRTGIRVHELVNDFDSFKKRYEENFNLLEKLYGKLELNPEEELKTLKEFADRIRPLVIDASFFLNQKLKEGKRVLVEGANGAMLDIDHGTYPFVTSSNPTIGGIITGTGLPSTKFKNIIGIMKAYTTRVGSGPFPTELNNELGEKIREKGNEYGATTGRPRRCGWLDAVVGKYAVMVDGLTDVNLTKLDTLTGIPKLKIAENYTYKGNKLDSFPADLNILENVEINYIEMDGWDEDISEVRDFENLPENAKKYVEKLESLIDCKITSIGIGPDKDAMIFR